MKKFLVCALPLFALTLLLTACTSGAPAPEPGMKNSETVLGTISGENVHGIGGEAFTGHKDETVLGIISGENVHSIGGEAFTGRKDETVLGIIPQDAVESLPGVQQ